MTNPISPDALDEKSLPQKIAEDIIALILEEHLQPGDKLPNESNLSNRLHAGRSSIREAMKLLASRNIVTIRQGSGTYVAAKWADENDIRKITALCSEVEDLLLQQKNHIQKDIEFHTAIAMSSKNLVVPRLIPVINSSIPLFVEITKSRLYTETIETHREITEAICAHDSVRAQDAMYLHLVYNRRLIQKMAET